MARNGVAVVWHGSLTLTTRVGRMTFPRASRGPITESTAPTPPPVQNGRDPSTPSSWPTAALREHTCVSRLGLKPASDADLPAASSDVSAGGLGGVFRPPVVFAARHRGGAGPAP